MCVILFIAYTKYTPVCRKLVVNGQTKKLLRKHSFLQWHCICPSKTQEICVQSVKPLEDMMMIVTFNTGEKRLFDASTLLHQPAFTPLKDRKVFSTPQIEYGVVTWADGTIDIAPQTMYQNSFEYQETISL